MKRLTDERIAALIDMGPLNEPPSTIVDVKSALIELQERRKAAGEQAGLFIRVNNMFFQVATAGNDCDESVRDQAIPLYTEPQFPDLKSEKSSLPVPKFDNEYIRTRLQVFDDTDEIVGWLSDLADEYYEERNFAEEYNLREAVTSLCGMYADLKDFGNELIRLQGNQAPVKQPASNANSPVIPDGYALVPVEPTPEMREAFHVANEEYEQGHYGIYSPDHQWQAMLATAPKPENAND
ncbi:hypothetical protein RLV03_000419 [Salmonella enterica subsp. enterica serovar Benin]|nr:hypothetical protein [Salmonella enterica]EIM5531709.1 hypothetical protein [Salmonella enterica subsp. enterica]EIW3445105.1 hypothetical protein [Salmonella enterica]ELD8107773.1 hypothetical protein [Salmonella enterica subsp. enterica serovar Benin]ELD9381976.1 hypothetical protein [Salmonella enterica subsp. enterica serovar Benin]